MTHPCPSVKINSVAEWRSPPRRRSCRRAPPPVCRRASLWPVPSAWSLLTEMFRKPVLPARCWQMVCIPPPSAVRDSAEYLQIWLSITSSRYHQTLSEKWIITKVRLHCLVITLCECWACTSVFSYIHLATKKGSRPSVFRRSRCAHEKRTGNKKKKDIFYSWLGLPRDKSAGAPNEIVQVEAGPHRGIRFYGCRVVKEKVCDSTAGAMDTSEMCCTYST